MNYQIEYPNLIFFFDKPPRVEIGPFEYCARVWPNDVFFIVMDKLPTYREENGWKPFESKYATVINLFEKSNPENFMKDFFQNYSDGIFIFNGFRSKSSKYLKILSGSKEKYKIMVWTERPGNYGSYFKRLLKKIFISPLYKIIYYKYNNSVDAVLPLGAIGVESFKKFGWPEEKLFSFMYCPSENFDKINNQESAGRYKKDFVKFLYVGRFSYSTKGLDILMEAFDEIESNNWTLTLVGGYGDKKEEVLEWINNKNNIIFDGSWESNKVIGKMANFDCVIVPSRFDGWNLIVNESIKSGISAIVSDQAVSHELIEYSNSGLVYESTNISDLVDKINYVINNQSIIYIWKENSFKFSKNINPDIIGEYFLEIINFIYFEQRNRPLLPWVKGNEQKNDL